MEFIAAIAIFLYGIRVSRTGLQLWGGDRLRSVVASLTDRRWLGLGVGAFVTLLFQSSAATVNLLVSFATSGFISLSQAMSVLLGADIGTTFVVVLLSVRKISQYALLILLIGVLLEMFTRSKRMRYLSMIFIGFGFIFYGLHLMVVGMEPFKQNDYFIQWIRFFSVRPAFGFFIAAALTPFLSSAGTLGLVLAFSFSGILSFEAALPYVLGANIGTCFTALASSFSGSTTGKQVAVAHLLFKLVGVALFFPFLPQFADAVHFIALKFPFINESGEIALAHILFNLTLVVLFFPFINQGVWLLQKLIPPSRKEAENPFAPRYLDLQSLDTPPLAFANVKRELLRVADLVHAMFRDSLYCYQKSDPDWVDEIEAKDNTVDLLDREIKLYLARLSQEDLTDDQAKLSFHLLGITATFEEIGDIVVQNILDMAGKKVHQAREFSDEGWSEICAYHHKILQSFEWAMSALASNDQELVHKVLRSVEHCTKEYEALRDRHVKRLQEGLKESFETSSIHLDTLSAFSRVSILIGDLVRPILEIKL